MNITEFRRRREERWQRLEQLSKLKRGFKSGDHLFQFIRLYRQTANDLAYARTYFPDDPVTFYLNSLVSSSYPRLYRFKRGGSRDFFRYLAFGFPSLFRDCFPYILLAFAITVFGALYGYILVLHSPLDAYRLLPPQFVNQFDPLKAGPHKVIAPIMSTLIMTNNIQVSLQAFVGGITFGMFTLYSLWQNGLILGILAAMFQAKGRSLMFWSLIVPHGVTELTAIFVAGGAGFLFAHFLIHPHGYSRGDALRYSARKAGLLFLGVVPMLVIAGTIEGFLTPSQAPMWVKYSTAVITGLFWSLYFGWSGRGRVRDANASGGEDEFLPPSPPHPPAELPQR